MALQSDIPDNSILALCQRSEWTTLDNRLRHMEKGCAELFQASEDSGWTPIFYVIAANRMVAVERMIELGAPIGYKTKDSRMVFHVAAAMSSMDINRMLINRAGRTDLLTPGGPLNQNVIHYCCGRVLGAIEVLKLYLKNVRDPRLLTDKMGNIPLLLAADVGNITVCRELLAINADQQINCITKDSGETVLHKACRRKDIDLVRLFCDYGAQIDRQNFEGHTALHIAAWEGDENIIKYFYVMKANPNIVDKMDRSPLHIAAERGHTAVVEVLVDKFRASVAARTKDGSTLMHIASQCGHPDTALMFLKKGVPLHMPNKIGAVCLHAAATQGHVAVVKSLLTKGAVVDAKNKDGFTALHLAVHHCKPLVVQALLGFGADVQLSGGKALETPLHIASRIRDGEKVAEMLLKSGANVNAAQEKGETALHIAARYGHLKMFKALLQDGADPCWVSNSGENPLHIAVRHCRFKIVKELTDFLIVEKSRSETVLLVNASNHEGETPMHYAAELTREMAHKESEDEQIISLLLKFDADLYTTTKFTNETPLHYCARAGNAKILQSMVEYLGEANVQLSFNKQAKNGWSPLLVASEQGHLEVVKILLKNLSRVDVFDEHGKAALHLASENGHTEVADVLLWHKAFVNTKSKIGVTPLHLAAMNGHNQLVKLLIETHHAAMDALSLAKKTPLHMASQNGQLDVCNTLLGLQADSNAVDIDGQTPLHLAAENDHSEVVKLFLNHRPELVSIANKDGSTCAHIAASKGSTAVIKGLLKFNKDGVINNKNKSTDSTALHLAAAGGHKDVVRILIETGADPLEENSEGMTPLHLAAKHGHVGVLQTIKKTKMHLKHTSKKSGLTALHIASHYGQSEFCQDMLTEVPATVRSEPPEGTDPSLAVEGTQEFGLTPLHLASQSGHESLVRLLLNSPGVQVDAQTYVNGTTPLHMAAQAGNTAVVGLLLSKSTLQLHTRDKRGRTGLHLAAANGHKEMVALLIGQGADINAYDKNDWRPIHFSSKAGHTGVVELLINSGAQPEYETKDNKVPICYAAANNHQDVLNFLMKKDHNTHRLMDDKRFVFDLMICAKMTSDSKPIRDFILLSPAPLETAIKLARNYMMESGRKKDRAKDLVGASVFCQEVAVDLMTVATGSNSAASLLKATDFRGVQLLDILMECEQKDVVAHAAVQKYLSDIWMGSLKISSWKIFLLFLFLLLPPVFILFCIPSKNCLRINRVPIVKMLIYLTSHIYLIGLLTLTTAFRTSSTSNLLLPSWNEWLLLMFFSGLLLVELTNPSDKSALGWIKIIVIVLASLAVVVHLLGFALNQTEQYDAIYVRNQLLALALMLTFVQFLDFLTFHHLFGPWAIIIRDLMKDLFRFMILLAIFLLGFTLTMSALNQPAYPEHYCTQINKFPARDSKGQNLTYLEGGRIVVNQFNKLSFALFGLTDDDDMTSSSVCIPSWGKVLILLMYGCYLIIAMIVLVNLLIAMMSDTYQRIQQQSDTEWKFGRAKLIRSMNGRSPTAPPINLITKTLFWLKSCFKYRGKVCSIHTDPHSEDYEEDFDSISETRSVDITAATGSASLFKSVMRRSSKVTPERSNKGPVRLEAVVDWDTVVKKYRDMHQIEEDDGDFKRRKQDDEPHFTDGSVPATFAHAISELSGKNSDMFKSKDVEQTAVLAWKRKTAANV